MSKENDMHIFRPWKQHLKSFKKVELISEYSCVGPEVGDRGPNPPFEKSRYLGSYMQ